MRDMESKPMETRRTCLKATCRVQGLTDECIELSLKDMARGNV